MLRQSGLLQATAPGLTAPGLMATGAIRAGVVPAGVIPAWLMPATLVVVVLGLLTGCAGGGSGTATAPNEAPEAAPASVAVPAATGPSRPEWRLGDEWVWSDGYALKVSAIKGRRTTFERMDAEEQWHERDGLFWTGSKSATSTRQLVYRSADPSSLYPLAVGKEVIFEREYLSNGDLRRHRTSWVVEGRQRIEVPAGTFDTWIITRRTRSIISDWSGYERWFYAPAVGHYARLEYQYGDGSPGVRVLMSHTPGR